MSHALPPAFIGHALPSDADTANWRCTDLITKSSSLSTLHGTPAFRETATRTTQKPHCLSLRFSLSNFHSHSTVPPPTANPFPNLRSMHLQKNFVVGLLALHFLNLAASLKTNDEFGIGLSFFDTNEANGKLSTVEREQLEEAKSLYKQDRLFSSYNIAQQLLKKLDDKSNFTDG